MELVEARAIVLNIAATAMPDAEVNLQTMTGAEIRTAFRVASGKAVQAVADDVTLCGELRMVARAYLDGTL